MKVVDLINKLNEIGYDENTELTFSCVDGNSGECYEVPFDEISFGENLTGEPYRNDVIDIGLDVDSVKDYIQAKSDGYVNDMIDEIREVLSKHDPWKKLKINLIVEEVEINHFFFVAEMRWIMNWADIKMEIPNMQVDLYVWGVWVKIC